MEQTPHQIDELLTVLRKHKVHEFRQDQFGVQLKFVTEAVRFSGVEAWATPARTEPDLPELGSVEPTKYELEDVLFGAK